MKFLPIALLLLSPAVAYADTVTITASMTVGAESITGSVTWDTSTNTLVKGSDQITSQGPLGAFTLSFTQLGVPCTEEFVGPCGMPFVVWQDSAGDVFQIDPSNGSTDLTFPQTGNYNSALIDLYCAGPDSVCYALEDGGFLPGNAFGGSLVVTSALPVPEPSALVLLLPLGLLPFRKKA